MKSELWELDQLKSELRRAFSMIDVLANKYDAIQNELIELKKAISHPSEKKTRAAISTSVQFERNVEELRSLDHKQVCSWQSDTVTM